MKNILNLIGAQKLSKGEQQNISGGWATDTCEIACQEGTSNPFYYKCLCGLEYER